MTSQRSAVDRILNALGHPVRRRILVELANGPGSWDDMLWTMALGQGLFRAVEASRSKGR